VRNKLIAQRYAKAIILNMEDGMLDSLLEDINSLKAIFSQDPSLIKSFDSFLYPLKKRIDLALNVADKLNNKNIWENLFRILIKKHRFTIILDILIDLEERILDSRNQIKVLLKIAHEQTDNILNDIVKVIKDILKKDVVLDIEIDPEIIGGFIAQTNSILIDGSIKNNLVRLVKINNK
jgi:F-type H+-transporting ATPase subunit delta